MRLIKASFHADMEGGRVAHPRQYACVWRLQDQCDAVATVGRVRPSGCPPSKASGSGPRYAAFLYGSLLELLAHDHSPASAPSHGSRKQIVAVVPDISPASPKVCDS